MARIGSSVVTQTYSQEASTITDITDTEALLVRKDGDSGDVFVVDTVNEKVSAVSVVLPLDNDAATPTLAFGDGDTGLYEKEDDYLHIATAGNILLQLGESNADGRTVISSPSNSANIIKEYTCEGTVCGAGIDFCIHIYQDGIADDGYTSSGHGEIWGIKNPGYTDWFGKGNDLIRAEVFHVVGRAGSSGTTTVNEAGAAIVTAMNTDVDLAVGTDNDWKINADGNHLAIQVKNTSGGLQSYRLTLYGRCSIAGY